MKNIKIIAALLLFLGFTVGCDKDFEQVNTDPNSPVAVESGLLLADIVRNAGNQMYSTFAGGDMGSCWAQHWAKVQYNEEERYLPRESVIGSIWDVFYEAVASDAKTMYGLADAEGNSNNKAVALTIEAFSFALLTDLYGDVPFSEALSADESIMQPKYDTQEEVYTGVLALLTEASTLYSANGGTINANSDLLYSGDWTKWQKFTNSLKFRVLMRMSAKTDVSAELTALMSKPMFTSNSDEAKLVYLASQPNANPIYETIVYGVRNEFKVNSVLTDMLVSLNDPRLTVYAQPNADGDYRGKPSGIADVPSEEYNYENVSPVGEKYLEPTAPAYFMSYSELQFLIAEAVVKGYVSGNAQMYYTNGIAASMDANGVDMTGYNVLLPSDEAAALEKIATQNWLGLYCQGMEVWTEWRRTGFPVLTPAIDGDIDEIPSRYTYPSSEQSLNKANWAEAVARQGSDVLKTKVWWNK